MKTSVERWCYYTDRGKLDYLDSNLSHWQFAPTNPTVMDTKTTWWEPENTMYCHVYVTCSSSVPYRTTDLQCTCDSKYWLAAASGLCSGQFLELERSIYWNCGERSVSNRSGSVCLGCDVRLRWWRQRVRIRKRDRVPLRNAPSQALTPSVTHNGAKKMNGYCKNGRRVNGNFIYGWLMKLN